MSERKVLVVEDNRANMELTRVILKQAGYVVLAAENADAGIALARAEAPDLILMDIGLPGMDGLAATAALKRDPATSRIPVVALTSHAMKDDREKILAAGCDGYIAKPLDVNAFRRLIASFIPAAADESEGDRGRHG